MNAHTAPIRIETLVQDAQQGNTESLNKILQEIHQQIYRISLRFLSNPHDAEDACQEIIIRIFSNLNSFRGESQFKTWAYRVAFNTLVSIKNQKKEIDLMSFSDFSEDIHSGMNDHDTSEQDQPDYQRLLQEIRIACTLAMLQCLDDEARMTYILGEIFEMDHSEGAYILSISQENFRKRLSRARSSVIKFMSDNCGLVNENNRCRCSKQVGKCLKKGCINREALLFSRDSESASQFPAALQLIRNLDETQRAAALFRQIPSLVEDEKYKSWITLAVNQVSDINLLQNGRLNESAIPV